MKYYIRYDWQATIQGMKGGLNTRGFTQFGERYPKFGQRIDMQREENDLGWEKMKDKVREIARVEFGERDIHNFDGEYLSGIVLMEDNGVLKPL